MVSDAHAPVLPMPQLILLMKEQLELKKLAPTR